MTDFSNSCIFVVGGYVNGLSIIHEISNSCDAHIYLVDKETTHASFSNKITGNLTYKNSSQLKDLILKFSTSYQKIIIFVSNDLAIEELVNIYDYIQDCVLLPFNTETVLQSMNKAYQYSLCEDLGIPVPKTKYINNLEDFNHLRDFEFPVIIKPEVKNEGIFRTLRIDTKDELNKNKEDLIHALNLNTNLIISEIVEGSDENIYAYSCFKNEQGNIIDEWCGRKVSQFPDSFGVFSIANNDLSEQVLDYGRKLANSLEDFGYIEPEFKYDMKTNEFKLMEINLRPMMWHSLGVYFGHYLNLAFLQGKLLTKSMNRPKYKRVFLVYLKYEFIKLFKFKSGFLNFLKLYKLGDKIVFANFKLNDPLPFLIDPFLLIYNKLKTK